MALPPGGKTSWPPAWVDPVARHQQVWSAWHSGDPDILAAAYSQGNGVAAQRKARTFFGSDSGQLNRASQYRGGLVGAMARMFWGQPVPMGERRAKLHVPVAGDLASTSAQQLFGKAPRFTVDADSATQDRLDELVDDGFHTRLLEAAETCAALGGVFLRVAWDEQIRDRPWITVVAPDIAVPTFTWDKLTAVTFWRVLRDTGAQVVRHLEAHDLIAGTIDHGVYVGDQHTLGDLRPLTDYPETAAIAELPDLEDGTTIRLPEGTPPVVVYVPNALPNRLWRDLPGAAYLGRSDYAGVEGLMDSLDETYSSWMRDMRLSKKRLIVPQDYTHTLGRGQGAWFDADQEIFVPIKTALGDGGTGEITVPQLTMAVDEHQRTASALVEEIVRQAGYSPQTFGLADAIAITATEVSARERRTLTTRARKVNYWRPGLADIVHALLAIEATVFGTPVQAVRPDVEFPEAVEPDALQLAQTALALYQARAASIETLVRRVNPGWDEAEIAAEVARIQASPPEVARVTQTIRGGTETVDGHQVTAPIQPTPAGMPAPANRAPAAPAQPATPSPNGSTRSGG